ncbi:MAG: hypothetical protein ACLFRX_08450 [Gemmatimonadota bacterium]
MRDDIDRFARRALSATGAFLTGLGDVVVDWMRSDDLTVLVALAVFALVLLFFIVPNRRRY